MCEVELRNGQKAALFGVCQFQDYLCGSDPESPRLSTHHSLSLCVPFQSVWISFVPPHPSIHPHRPQRPGLYNEVAAVSCALMSRLVLQEKRWREAGKYESSKLWSPETLAHSYLHMLMVCLCSVVGNRWGKESRCTVNITHSLRKIWNKSNKGIIPIIIQKFNSGCDMGEINIYIDISHNICSFEIMGCVVEFN